MPQNRAHALMRDRRTVNRGRERTAADRLLIVAGLTLLWITAVFGRLAYLQLFCHSEYLARAARQQQRTIEITPKRGSIYDRNMHPLAMSIRSKGRSAPPASGRAGSTIASGSSTVV